MLKTKAWHGKGNHIKLPYNRCGGVYALDLESDKDIGSDYFSFLCSAKECMLGRSASCKLQDVQDKSWTPNLRYKNSMPYRAALIHT